MEHCGEHLKTPARDARNTCSGDPVFASSRHSAATHYRQSFPSCGVSKRSVGKLKHCFVMASVMKHLYACFIALN